MTSPILSELLQRTTALRALARDLVGDASADDVLQEAAIQTMTAPPARPGPVGGWLAAVVRNLAGKHRRAERIRLRHEAMAARAELTPGDRSAEDADVLRRLTEIVTSLPEPYRATILARYLREQTPSEIAAATNTPLPTVKTRLQRGLALLHARLDEKGGDWRALLVAAFALDPALARSRPVVLGTTMKLSLLAAIVLPFGLLLWHGRAGATLTAPADPTVVARKATEPGLAPAAPGSTAGPLAPAGPTMPVAAPASSPLSGARPAEGPLLRIDAVGPAAFRAAFRHTNLGTMLASEAGERLWRPLLAPAERIWRQWDGRDDGFAAARERVLAYAGRIRVLWMVEPGAGEERDRAFGVFALEPSGSADLAALADDIARALQAAMPVEATERSVDGHALRVLSPPGGDVVTVPVLIGGSLVAFFGEADWLDQAVPRCLRALATDAAQPSAPLSLHVDLAQLRGLRGARRGRVLQELFGLASLRGLRAVVRPNGPHAEFELEVEFGEGGRGVLAGILPMVDGLPGLLTRVPPQATPWLTVPFRPDLIFRAGLAAAAAAAEGHEGGVDAVRRDLHHELGLHLDTELLDHLGGEVMVLGDLWQPDDAEAFRAGRETPLGACLAFSLRDTAAFDRGFDKVLAHLKGLVRRQETREVDGVTITRLGTMFATGMHMAVGQDVFAMAFGTEGVAQLEALVAGARTPAGPLPAAAQRMRHLAPPGWNGVGLADLGALFGGQLALMFEALEESVPRPMRPDVSADDTQAWLDGLRPLVMKHELDHLVTMTGQADGRWRLRVLW